MAIDVIRSKIVIADLSYIKPVFRANYLQIKVIAEVTMPDVLAVEILTPVDLVSLQPEKVFADTYSGFLDATILEPIKGLSEALSLVDSADITYSIGKALADAPAVVEALSYIVDKELPPDGFYIIDNMDGNIEFQIVKVINELQFIADQNNLFVAKNTSDSLTLADAATILLIYQRQFADILSSPTDEIASKNIAKGVFEALNTPETTIFSIEKPLADASPAVDTPYKTVDKLILGIAQDYCDPTYFLENYVLNTVTGDWLYTTNDVFSKEVTYGRNPVETLLSSDELQPFQVAKGILEELPFIDAPAITTNRPASDSFNLVDNMDGNIQYQVVKVINELQFIAEAQVIDLSTQKADNIVTSSNGILSVQDYSDITYFLEDYVGLSRTFT
jgi:hypothetical protein